MSSATQSVVSAASNSLTPYQWHGFVSQETELQIVPKFSMDRLDFVGDCYGPFYPNYPIRVPLWLALYLRETNACTISPPAELTVDFLRNVLKREAESDNGHEAVSPEFFDVARQLLRFASADVPDAVEVHRLINELESCRATKIQHSVGALTRSQFPPPAMYFAAFATGEVETLRATFLAALNDGADLAAAASRRAVPPALPAPRPSGATSGRSTVPVGRASVVDSAVTGRFSDGRGGATDDADGSPYSAVPTGSGAPHGVARPLDDSYPTAAPDQLLDAYAPSTTAGADTDMPETGAAQAGGRRRRTLRQR